MDIRLNKENEIDSLVNIWYEGSLLAHDFIDKNFWKSHCTKMKEEYLPNSETYVVTDKGEIVGFISMVESYLAALFIDHNHQSKGYGKELLNFIKEQRDAIQLKVYKKNDKAINFYLKNGFVEVEELQDEKTGEREILMEWERSP
ncbi:N-acetyltransferase [Piscibacillus halophilus]|uniref:Putative acetyltransferase n=1 Tax=Piscibacillus halophilus TaxID=571933 RepID=A0A1H9KRC6_9BACI|nr:N-acetyltransferase [Piscibacillus halophilus]SER01714.1 putative acetyltransferase [Piscibacillus halophilus]